VGITRLVHREQDPPVHWLQPVAQVRNRATDDDRHRVIEIGGTHLLLDGDGRSGMGVTRRLGEVVVAVGSLVAQGVTSRIALSSGSYANVPPAAMFSPAATGSAWLL